MSKFSNKNKPKPKVHHVAVMLNESQFKHLEKIAFNKSGWCTEAVIAAMEKHDYDSKG